MSLKKWPGVEKGDEDDIQNLIVFGYHCKIFRDDEKALFIDKGNHLIPWMGDSSLMIDRYDGRGHISDLRPFDADNVDTSHYTLSDKEKAVEKAADEERYLELRTDIVQQQLYEEEEMKRLYESMGEGYAAVGFNYEQPQAVVQPQTKPEEDPEEEDDDFPYETIPELQVPKGVNLPGTIKMHAIIEKTAAFVAKQGPQMEIVVATKQANNRQFDFLHYSHELNVYYKHMVKMIKNGKYTPKPQEEYSKIRRRRSSENAPHHDYLHPSLGGGGQENEDVQPQSQENFLQSVTTKLPTGQIANTAYAKLLTNLSKHRPESPVPSGGTAAKEASGKNGGAVDSSVRKLGSKNLLGDKNQPLVPGMEAVTLPGPNQPPPPGTEPLGQLPPHQLVSEEALPGAKEGYEYPYNQAMEGWGSSTKEGEGEGNYNSSRDETKPVYYGPQGPPVPKCEQGDQSEAAAIVSKRISEREEESESIPPDIEQPPNELRSIIDKMAQYVVRNGPEFEMMMKSKKDERFSFLEAWHKFNKYYEVKVKEFKRILAAEKGEDEGAGDGSASQRGVSFSIKPKDSESGQVAPKKRRALLADSDEDGEEKSGSSAESSSEESDEQSAKDVPLKTYTQGNEGNDLDRKLAEENLKNKLALAARGKLFQAREDDKVKAERKKKAAMFAALLKNNPSENLEGAIPKISSVSSLASLGTSREASPLPTTPSRGSIVTNASTDYTSRSRTQSPAPLSATKLKKKDGPRSRSPKSKKRSRRKSRSRSRQRSRSRSRHRRRRRRSSGSSSPKSTQEVGLPSAYTVMRRSSPPKEIIRKKARSKSRSPSRHKRSKRSRSRSPRRSRSHRSRSRSRTRRHKRSRSKESRSKGKSKSRKRSRSREKRKSKKSKRSKPKMIPIPELAKSGTSSHSESEEEKETITIEDSPEQNTAMQSNEGSGTNSLANSPYRVSDVESRSSENAVKPSENLLMKVRAMLRSQREEATKNGFPGE